MTGLTIALSMALLSTAPMPTQATKPSGPPTQSAADVGRLDALLAAKDYVGLTKAITEPADAASLRTNLDCMRERMRSGSTTLVAILYARMLWEISTDVPEASRTGMRDMAMLATLYAYGAVAIDGQRCGDRTAPVQRQRQALAVPGMLEYYHTLPADRQAKVVQGALMTDRITAASRDAAGDVAFVCSGGLEETSYNLRAGTAREVPTKAGQVGRQILLTGDGRYRPSERPESEWRPAMARVRASLPETLRLMQQENR